jgi:histone deacetylase complex regulatory component SIN3
MVQAKEEEWRGVRRDMNKIWKDVYERNYLKSLDHRSFYFKQIDKRNLSSKGLVSEMRSMVEAGTPAVVHYPCADVSLHKDVFDLIMLIADSDSRSARLARVLPVRLRYNPCACAGTTTKRG